MPIKSYQTDLLQRLSSQEYAAEYLRIAWEETMKDSNTEAFILALKNVMEAHQSNCVINNEKDSNDSQNELIQTLVVNHPLTIETLWLILQRVGLTLSFQPINEEATMK